MLKTYSFDESLIINENLALHFVILYANYKQYIFHCLKGSEIPILYGLIGHLKMHYHVSKFISETKISC